MNKRLLSGMMAAVTGACSVFTIAPMTAYASVSYEMRKKIILAADIIDSFDVTDTDKTVSRAEFAKMLIRASSYNSSVSAYNGVSVFSDVAIDNKYASFIKIATEQGWMSAYLGGAFKPDQPVKLHEAVRACLALLGYANSDFTGNQVANRIAKSQAIGLTTDIGKNTADELTYGDCVNLFYNLMRTNTKANENATKSSNTIYGSFLGFELTSDDELNMLNKLESNLKGPYAVNYSVFQMPSS